MLLLLHQMRTFYRPHFLAQGGKTAGEGPYLLAN